MKTLLLLCLVGFAFGGISQTCMNCICKAAGCQAGTCKTDGGSTGCGPYLIHQAYWIDGGRQGGNFQTCTKQFGCSDTTVRNYMARYGPNCRNGNPTCEDYMRMHKGGPTACNPGSSAHTNTNSYWSWAQKNCF